jgi:non-heme chloroperoxidase
MNHLSRVAATALLLLLLTARISPQQPAPWHDPSPHKVQFVSVDENVKLEVLDWGGSGRPIVLLAGSGNTAHVFDDFAPKLIPEYHVYGITRRGFGVSSHPDSGYTDQRLADDVLRVLDSLNIVAPVLVGHSMAGSELTTLGARHSDRLSGLVYLEALRDPTRDYSELTKKLPAAMQNPPHASEADRKSFQAFRDWQTRTLGFALPESELRNDYAANPDGSMGKSGTPGTVFEAIADGTQKRDYADIRVPVLAMVGVPATPSDVTPGNYQPRNPQERGAMKDVYAAVVNYIRVDEKNLKMKLPAARVIELHKAKHYIFLSNEADVLREMRAFLAGLP